jgi:hypothetical protein
MSSSRAADQRRQYSPPALVVLGDFRKITGGDNVVGARDGGVSGPKTKTTGTM